MVHQHVYRFSGLSIVAGTAFLTTGYWLRPYIEKQFADDFASPEAMLSSLLVAAGILLLIAGLPAMFARQMQRMGTSGMLGAALFFVGIAAFHLGTLALYFVLPVLVTHSTETRELVAQDYPPFPRFAIFWGISFLLQVVGLIWFSIKSWKADIYPRAASILLGSGAVALLAAPVLNFRLLQPASTLVMIGLAWYGISLIIHSYHAASQTQKKIKYDSQKSFV